MQIKTLATAKMQVALARGRSQPHSRGIDHTLMATILKRPWGQRLDTHHMSRQVEQSVDPSRTSGGRYHRVTTSLEQVWLGTDFALARPGGAAEQQHGLRKHYHCLTFTRDGGKIRRTNKKNSRADPSSSQSERVFRHPVSGYTRAHTRASEILPRHNSIFNLRPLQVIRAMIQHINAKPIQN